MTYQLESSKEIFPLLNKANTRNQQTISVENGPRESQYLQEFKKYFVVGGKPCPTLLKQEYEKFSNLLAINRISYLLEIQERLSTDQFISFLATMSLQRKSSGVQILEKGRKNHRQYILLSGTTGFYQELDSINAQLECVGHGQIGQPVCCEIFLSNRFSSFSVTCLETCTFLVFSEETWTRFVKKITLRKIDEKINFLSQNAIFEGISEDLIRKNSHYFLPYQYKYKDVIYSEGRHVEQVYIILEGQIELSLKGRSLVKLGAGYFFGHDNSSSPVRKYQAVSIADRTKVFALNVHILRLMSKESKIIMTNIESYNQKESKVHEQLISRNTAIQQMASEGTGFSRPKPRNKKKGKKKKRKKFEWWGLAENLPVSQRYRVPVMRKPGQDNRSNETFSGSHNSFYKYNSMGIQNDNRAKTAMDLQIGELKKRILKGELQQLQENQQLMNNLYRDQQSKGSHQYAISKFFPKNKVKIKMLDVKPKAVNTAEITKKKLLNYAKNMGNFCDRLDFQ